MNALIDFLEQYWGITLFGGVTVGGLFTFAFVQARYLIKTKTKDEQIDALLAAGQAAIEKNHAKDVEKAELLQKNEYLQKVITTSFKAISFLTASSKLPIEEKLAIQEDFIALKEEGKNVLLPKIKELKEQLVDTAEDFVEEVTEDVVEVVEAASDLMSKYVNKEGS